MTATAGPLAHKPSAPRSALALLVSLLISFTVAALGTVATLQNVTGWYAAADKAFWTPPNGAFGPVWTVLYILMSIAAWLVWRQPPSRARRIALGAYVVQLALNAVWTPVFFGLFPEIGAAALWIALGIILALDVMVLVTILRFWRVRRIAAVLLLPYWAWVLYATTLNVYIAANNG